MLVSCLGLANSRISRRLSALQDAIDTETFNSQEFMEYLKEYRFVTLDGGEDPTDDDNPPEGKFRLIVNTKSKSK